MGIPMDINSLKQALNLSLSIDKTERQTNEQIIFNARKVNGFCYSMLQISTDNTVSFGVQQNAIIQLKNVICRNWKYGSDTELNKSLRFEEEQEIIVINEEEKDFIRKNIFNSYTLMTNKLLRKQLGECIKKISKLDLS